MGSVASVPVVEAGKSTRRIWCPFHVTIAAVVVVFTFFFCGHSVADPDIWWHLKNAQILVQQHHWVRADQFSYTIPGTPWINSEWLAELMYYGAWRAGGIAGLFLLYVVMAETLMVGILMLAYKASRSIKAAAIAGAVAVIMCVVNFGPRTILFGWACLIALMFVLWELLDTGDAPLWTIPILFLLWVNLHGSWLIGLVVFSLVVGSGFVSGSWGIVEAERWTPKQARKLLITAAAIVPALFINPYGYKSVFYPFDMAYRQKLNIAHIEEWASLDFHEVRGKIVYLLIVSLILLALAGRRKWKLAEVGLVAFSLYISLTYVRFLFPAAILIAPILARKLDFVPPYKREIDRAWLNAVFSGALLAVVVHRYPSAKALAEDLNQKMPTGGTHYLQTHAGPGDRIFNQYVFGGYMIWSTPALPTFIDSRTDIFEYKGILADYLNAVQLKDSLAIFDRYGVKFVFFPAKDPVTYLMRQSVKWRLVYEDGVSCVFERI